MQKSFEGCGAVELLAFTARKVSDREGERHASLRATVIVK